jgi:hypothetical protein
MKHLLVFLTVFCCYRLLAADDAVVVPEIWKNPTPFLEEIVKQIPSIDPTVEGDTDLSRRLQTMAYAINQDIMAAESQDWAHPSPARKAIIEKWGKALEPYTRELVDLALGDDYLKTYSARQSRSLLDFAAPSEKFASEVRKHMTANSPHVLEDAASLLFEHRLLSEADKNALRQLMPSAKNDEDKIRYALTLYSYGIPDWENFLLEYAKATIETRPPSNDPEVISKFYRFALVIPRGLGTKAQPLVPALEALVEYMKVNCPGYLPHAESARDAAKGLSAETPRDAKNGSGFLIQSLAADVKQVEGNLNPSEQSPPTLKKAPETKPSLTTPSEDPASSTPWSIIVVLIVAAIGLLWLLLKKRK